MKRQTRPRGYTLVEVAVFTAVVAMISLLGLMRVTQFRETSQVRSLASSIADDLRWVQQKALVEQRAYKIIVPYGQSDYELWRAQVGPNQCKGTDDNWEASPYLSRPIPTVVTTGGDESVIFVCGGQLQYSWAEIVVAGKSGTLSKRVRVWPQLGQVTVE